MVLISVFYIFPLKIKLALLYAQIRLC